MSLTTDRNNPCLKETRADGQQECYLVLSEEERAKGFVRPVRTRYKHIGIRPQYPLRELTDREKAAHQGCNYVAYEAYPESDSSAVGRYWTQAQLHSGCGSVTTMGQPLAETYARQPDFYGATFCVQCGKHLPVAEFEWIGVDGKPDGSRLGE